MAESSGEPIADPGRDAPASIGPDEQGETHRRPGRKHRFRWFCICTAASATVMILVLLLQLRQDLPLSFGGSLLLAGLAGLVVPALVRISLGHRWADKGLRPAYFWLGACLVQIIILSVLLVI